MQCRRDGCEDRATHYPRILAWAKGHRRGSHQPLEIVLDVPLCRKHALERRQILTPEWVATMDRTIDAMFPESKLIIPGPASASGAAPG